MGKRAASLAYIVPGSVCPRMRLVLREIVPFTIRNALTALQVRSMCKVYGVLKNQGAIHDLFKIGAALAALILVSIAVAPADDLTGPASVIDGDNLEIHGTGIRLWGVDAPESSQLCRGGDSLQYQCGAKAANDLDAFIARRSVNCLPASLDSPFVARQMTTRRPFVLKPPC
jgi:endonuclease YncB( thermonuclease family)